jgi:hypothetical protein
MPLHAASTEPKLRNEIVPVGTILQAKPAQDAKGWIEKSSIQSR